MRSLSWSLSCCVYALSRCLERSCSLLCCLSLICAMLLCELRGWILRCSICFVLFGHYFSVWNNDYVYLVSHTRVESYEIMYFIRNPFQFIQFSSKTDNAAHTIASLSAKKIEPYTHSSSPKSAPPKYLHINLRLLERQLAEYFMRIAAKKARKSAEEMIPLSDLHLSNDIGLI